jgi:hypothetical protein
MPRIVFLAWPHVEHEHVPVADPVPQRLPVQGFDIGFVWEERFRDPANLGQLGLCQRAERGEEAKDLLVGDSIKRF